MLFCGPLIGYYMYTYIGYVSFKKELMSRLEIL